MFGVRRMGKCGAPSNLREREATVVSGACTRGWETSRSKNQAEKLGGGSASKGHGGGDSGVPECGEVVRGREKGEGAA